MIVIKDQRILNAKFKIVIVRFCMMIAESFELFVIREIIERIDNFMFC